MILRVTTKTQLDSIINDNERVALMFTAPWCGDPCKKAILRLKDNAASFPTIQFITVDTEENSETTEIGEAYEISGMPFFKFFKNGQPFGEDVVGSDPERLQYGLTALAAC